MREKADRLQGQGIRLIAGAEAEQDASSYDYGILSPGIDPAVRLVRNFANRNIELIGELELAWEHCECPVIAITGTNGKTTTTQLVEAMLLGCGVRTAAAGNIGPAFSARVLESAGMEVMTLEVSSFQLEAIQTFRPSVAVWLNFAPDHLDRYRSMAEYYAAKLRVFENQTGEDWAVVRMGEKLPELAARKITFSASQMGGDFELRDGVIYHHGSAVLAMAETKLRGSHNAENLMAALAVGVVRGISFERMIYPLRVFQPLPHRCESVRVLDGVEYINDTKATNLDAMEKALASETRPVILIAGGKDKGFAFDSVAGLVGRRCRAAVLIGEMAESIAESWMDRVPCLRAGTSIETAVHLAREQARPGDVVLLSPGTSSFDMFKNYADRGSQFRAAVHSLTEYTTNEVQTATS